MERSGVSILSTLKGKAPLGGLPFSVAAAIKNAVLGIEYELSLVLCASTLSRRLNRERRGKNKPANVLSFPLSPESGEIFIDVRQASRQARRFGASPEKFFALLLIHGLHHLKGMEHGSKMEREEEKVRKKFRL